MPHPWLAPPGPGPVPPWFSHPVPPPRACSQHPAVQYMPRATCSLGRPPGARPCTQHAPRATWAARGSSRLCAREALSPGSRSHHTEQRPALGTASPRLGGHRAVTQPRTPVTWGRSLWGQTPLPWGPKPFPRAYSSLQGPWPLGGTAEGPLLPPASAGTHTQWESSGRTGQLGFRPSAQGQ